MSVQGQGPHPPLPIQGRGPWRDDDRNTLSHSGRHRRAVHACMPACTVNLYANRISVWHVLSFMRGGGRVRESARQHGQA